MSRAVPFALEARHWEIIAVVPDERGLAVGLVGADGTVQRCRHDHPTQDEATMCPWTPTPWPVVCDLLVRQFRSEHRQEQAVMPWGAG